MTNVMLEAASYSIVSDSADSVKRTRCSGMFSAVNKYCIYLWQDMDQKHRLPCIIKARDSLYFSDVVIAA